MEDISSEKEEIEGYKAQVLQNKKELDDKSLELSDLYEEGQAVMEELNADKTDVEERASALEGDLSEAEAAIDAWFEDYYAQQPAENGGTSDDNGSGDSGSGNSGGSSGGGDPAGSECLPGRYQALLGSLPIGGDGRNHQAIDIAGSGIYGQPIVAAASGTVSYAESGGWGGGYGTWLIIDHGNGYSTVYAHCSALAVGWGESVSQGQIIGYVGSTGDSTGPHLHFEVREYGTKVNPLNFFPRIG